MSSRLSRWCVLPLLTAAVSGCGGASEPADRPKRTPVTGTVLYQQQPVEGATVVFTPQGGAHGAIGVTDAKGRFKLTTFTPDDGAVPGNYGVAIRKTEVAAAPAGAADDADLPPAVQKSLLPDKYATHTTSGLQETVADGKANDFTFNLEEGPITSGGPARTPRPTSQE